MLVARGVLARTSYAMKEEHEMFQHMTWEVLDPSYVMIRGISSPRKGQEVYE
jgi:hypothetical protein